ncbi:MAG: ComC/BlpC family leader-containing pheromone/bacteriocin [Clostridiales bacterium]|nr:ComC/BlpC family leader-containing pheromone/bacteriocin [Clostridiales bacterium]
MKENKEEKVIKEKEQVTQELKEDELEQVTGGGTFSDVPRIKEHDYTDDVKSRV